MPKWDTVLAENTQIDLSYLDVAVDSGLISFNAFDNSCLTPDSIVWRFSDQPPISMSDHLIFFGPLGLAFAGTYLGLEFWERYRKRDAWDAYWQKEKARLKKLYAYLEENESKLLPDVINLEQHRFLTKIVEKLLNYEKQLKKWATAFSAHRKQLEKIRAVQKEVKKLKKFSVLTTIVSKVKSDEAEQELTHPTDVFTHNFEQAKELLSQSEIAAQTKAQQAAQLSATLAATEVDQQNNGNVFKKLLEKLYAIKPLQAIYHAWVNFSGSFWFQIPFAWAWGYWFVFFFSRWGIANPCTEVPLDYGLFALTGSILYLLYHEYCTYKNRLLDDGSTLTEAQQNELKPMEDEVDKLQNQLKAMKDKIDKRQKKLKAMEETLKSMKERTSEKQAIKEEVKKIKRTLEPINTLNTLTYDIWKKRQEMLEANKNSLLSTIRWRRIWGWGFVALIAGASVAMFCGLPVGLAILAGIGVTLSVGFIAKGLCDFFDKQTELKRETINIKEQKWHSQFQLILLKEPGELNLRNINSIKDKAIIVVGNGDERIAYFVEQGKFILNKQKNPLCVKLKLHEFLSPEDQIKITLPQEEEILENVDQIPGDTINIPHQVKRAALKKLNTIPGKALAFRNKKQQKKMLFLVQYRLTKLAELKQQIAEHAAIMAENNSASLTISAQAPEQDQNPVQALKKELSQTIQKIEKFKPKPFDFSDKNLVQTTLASSISNPQVEQSRKYLAAVLGFFAGITLGCILAFPICDFIGHVASNVANFLDNDMIASIVVGIFSLFVGVSQSRRKFLEEKTHLGQLELQRLDPDYLQKQAHLNQLNQTISHLRQELAESTAIIQAKLNKTGQQTAYAKNLYHLIKKPGKKNQSMRKKIIKTAVFVLRALFKTITDISRVILMARALLTMGICKAVLPLIFSQVTINFAVFGMFGSALVANPLGIAVLVVAVIFLVAKVVLDLYMMTKKQQELEKIAKIDLKLAKKETEYEHLMQVQNLLVAEKYYLNIPLSENEKTNNGLAMPNNVNDLSDTDDSDISDRNSYINKVLNDENNADKRENNVYDHGSSSISLLTLSNS